MACKMLKNKKNVIKAANISIVSFNIKKQNIFIVNSFDNDFLELSKFYRRWCWEAWRCCSEFLNCWCLNERRLRVCLLVLRNELWLFGVWLLLLLWCVKLRGGTECLLIWLEFSVGIWRRWLLWNRGFYWLVIVRNCVCNERCICVLFGLFARCSKWMDWIDWIDFWTFQCFTSLIASIAVVAVVWSVLSVIEGLSKSICIECASSQKIGWPWIGVVWITAADTLAYSFRFIAAWAQWYAISFLFWGQANWWGWDSTIGSTELNISTIGCGWACSWWQLWCGILLIDWWKNTWTIICWAARVVWDRWWFLIFTANWWQVVIYNLIRSLWNLIVLWWKVLVVNTWWTLGNDWAWCGWAWLVWYNSYTWIWSWFFWNTAAHFWSQTLRCLWNKREKKN